MNLIKINLLPYREMEEQKKKKQFQTIMVIGAAAGLVAAGLIYSSLAGMILNQQGRNESLQAGIATLDKELYEIRHPIYRETAHIVLEVGKLGCQTTLNKILEMIEEL